MRSGDPEAWQHRDRLWAERGTNPDLLVGPPETDVERRMRERRGYAFKLAADAWICGDDPAVAEGLAGARRDDRAVLTTETRFHVSAAYGLLRRDNAIKCSWHMNRTAAMNDERHVKIFRNGANQAVRIPKEFELPGSDAIMRKDGARLIIEPAPASTIAALRALTARWRREPPLDDLDDPWADIADPLPGPVDL